VVDDVVPARAQVLDERDLQLEPGVVSGDMDTHGPILPHVGGGT
jgi:hypothetical protein